MWRCDLALLVIDPSSRDSVDFVMALMVGIENVMSPVLECGLDQSCVYEFAMV